MKKVINIFLMILCMFSMFSMFSFAYAEDPSSSPAPTHNQMDVTMSGAEKMTKAGDYRINIGALKSKELDEISKDFLGKYKTGISIISGCGALTMLLFFVLNFAKLGKSAGNPQMRQSAMMGIIFTGIGTLLLAGVMTFFTFFYNFLG